MHGTGRVKISAKSFLFRNQRNLLQKKESRKKTQTYVWLLL